MVFSNTLRACLRDYTAEQMCGMRDVEMHKNGAVLDALTYFKFVLPICHKITRHAVMWFKDFPNMYDDVDTFVKDIDLV